MMYEILGSVTIRDGERSAEFPAQKVQVLLILLLSRANRMVNMDEVIKEIWGEDIPRRAVDAVYVYISQLRKVFDYVGGLSGRIATKNGGYLLRVEEDELDVTLFLKYADQGRALARENNFPDAADCFDRARRCWRGPLRWEGDGGPSIQAFAAYLNENYLGAIEISNQISLRLGRHHDLISDLYALVTEHPLREIFYSQLMTALYLSGRRADALSVYAAAREILLDQLGLEPCRQLRELQQAVLADEDAGTMYDYTMEAYSA
jgi:DNA-binding SARP family transcriptional activator